MEHSVFVEIGSRRSFASALEWPGWSRSGRDESAALEHLAATADRYAVIASAAGVAFDAGSDDTYRVVERAEGNASTDFGAPDIVAAADQAPVDAATARRYAALLAAAWRLLEHTASQAPPELRKGPRGGGRDRDAMLRHVAGSEFGYARRIGVRHSDAAEDPEAVSALRGDVLAVIGTPSDGGPLTPRGKGWPHRYAARRFTWHVVDHLWEMEDRIPA